jgi:hypothetical protein
MPAPAAPAAVPGHAVLARVEGRALVIWDSTLEVAQIVKDKLPDAAAKDRLERDALGELLLEAPNLGRARSVDVRVVYTKTGGVERYATLTMPAADVKRDRGRWQEAATGGGALPAWIEFSISGELPPR